MHYQLGLIGYPIEHSLSPWIHEQFLKLANLNGTYSIMEIDPHDSFEKEINKLNDKQLNGFNVTVPFKKRIIPYLDELDENALSIGAVNTVVCKNNKWIGYNTDGAGYVAALKNNFPDFFRDGSSKRILMIGAGGASRGLYYHLLMQGFDCIDIANRTESSAKSIASLNKTNTRTMILDLEQGQEAINRYDLIIQTTSVGMKPDKDNVIMTVKKVKENSIVSDIVYQPLETKFLSQAKSAGASIHFGHTMLLYQAQYAFELWTNQLIPITDMDQQLQYILEGR